MAYIDEKLESKGSESKEEAVLLGSGSYGSVYSSNNMAWKHVLVADSSWIRDVFIVRSLDHPNIIKYHCVEPVGGKAVGKSHSDFLTVGQLKLGMTQYERSLACQRNWTAKDVLLIFGSLMKALHHCHQNNVIHRDVKEENILINGGPQTVRDVVLCDFGLAKFHWKLDPFLSRSVATISHRPPEVHKAMLLDEVLVYGPGVDVWSACMVLANLVSRTTFFKYIHKKQSLIESELKIDGTVGSKKAQHSSSEEKTFSSLLLNTPYFYKIFDIFLEEKMKSHCEKPLFLKMIKAGVCSPEKRWSTFDFLRLLNVDPLDGVSLKGFILINPKNTNPFDGLKFNIYKYHIYLKSPPQVYILFEHLLGRLHRSPELIEAIALYTLAERLLLDHYTLHRTARKYWLNGFKHSILRRHMLNLAAALGYKI